MRLDKYVCEALGITRKQATALLAKRQVMVNGAPAKGDAKVTEADAITLNGKPLAAAGPVYIMLNKPKGVVSAAQDKRDVTVVDLVAEGAGRNPLFPAGRLDKTSTGFVLLTDDGAFAHDILSPRHHVSKTYVVTLDAPCTPQMVQAFEQGVTLADGETMKPALLQPSEADPCVVTVVLKQGVYHQIKRMFGVFDVGVNELHRTAIGGVVLDAGLAPGGWRALTAQEVQLLKDEARC